MTKRMVLVGTLLLACAGCAANQRDDLVEHAIGLLSSTTSKVNAVRERIEDAMKKSEKGLDLTEATRAAEDLKAKGKELQQTSQAIRAMREPISKEEKEQYLERYKPRLEPEAAKLSEATLALNQKFRELEKMAQDPTSKAAVEDLGKKLKEAQGEYEGLARQQR